jgi:hypothetical protein
VLCFNSIKIFPMASDFVYFLSSLPALSFGGAASAMSYAQFQQQCADRLQEEEWAVIQVLTLKPGVVAEQLAQRYEVLQKWYAWMTVMLNAQVQWRARRLERDGNRYLKSESDAFPGDLKRLETVLALPEAAQRQEGWEAMQWDFLSNLEAGRYYDFQCVLIYALKLMILDARRGYDKARGQQVATEVIEKILAGAKANRKTD